MAEQELTAQILVGWSHTMFGGIHATHTLFLLENDRPNWVLVPQEAFMNEEPTDEGTITWIPTADSLLDDAMLMIAVHVVGDPELSDMMARWSQNGHEGNLDLTRDIPEAVRKELYANCRLLDYDEKVVIMLYEGSSLESQLKNLEEYHPDVEVWKSAYLRYYYPDTDEVYEEGSL